MTMTPTISPSTAGVPRRGLHDGIVVNTWAEEDAGHRLAHPGNPDGFCPHSCAGVSVLHPAHG